MLATLTALCNAILYICVVYASTESAFCKELFVLRSLCGLETRGKLGALRGGCLRIALGARYPEGWTAVTCIAAPFESRWYPTDTGQEAGGR